MTSGPKSFACKPVLTAMVVGCGLLLSGAHADIAEPATPIGAPTVKIFLAGCARDPGGCTLQIGSVLLDRMTFNGPSAFCLSTRDYVVPLTNWLKAHPETAALPSGDGIFLALKAVYPCA